VSSILKGIISLRRLGTMAQIGVFLLVRCNLILLLRA